MIVKYFSYFLLESFFVCRREFLNGCFNRMSFSRVLQNSGLPSLVRKCKLPWKSTSFAPPSTNIGELYCINSKNLNWSHTFFYDFFKSSDMNERIEFKNKENLSTLCNYNLLFSHEKDIQMLIFYEWFFRNQFFFFNYHKLFWVVTICNIFNIWSLWWVIKCPMKNFRAVQRRVNISDLCNLSSLQIQ